MFDWWNNNITNLEQCDILANPITLSSPTVSLVVDENNGFHTPVTFWFQKSKIRTLHPRVGQGNII